MSRRTIAAAALLAALALPSCYSSQTRAHLPAPLEIRLGVTTRHDVIEAWGSPMAIRGEPEGRTVYQFRRDDAEGWGFAVGSAMPMTWILQVSSVRAEIRSAEFFFAGDLLEKVRIQDKAGQVRTVP